MAGQDPSPQTTLLILLGASSWPYSGLESSMAFANAAEGLRAYFLSDPEGFHLPPGNLLDLFDVDDSNTNILEQISDFLRDRRGQLNADIRDVLAYYIGHGGITSDSSIFYLAIRRTRKEYEKATSLAIDDLADRLKKEARFQRRILILDCCFAARAAKFLQGPASETLFREKTVAALSEKDRGKGFPSRGTSFLGSSGKGVASVLLPDETSTKFTQALFSALRTGDPFQKGERLSLSTVYRLTIDFLSKTYEDDFPRPELHSPDQTEGKVEDIPFFPNPWFEKEEARKATEEQASKAQEKDALQADERLILRTEAQPVRSAFELEPPHSGEKKQKARDDPSGRPPQPVHSLLNVKTRDEFLKEALGTWAEPYIPWFTVFCLLTGVGIGAATIIRSSVPYSWLWSMGTVLVATPLIYLTAYRKVVNISIMTIIALLSAAGAAGLAAYTSTFIHPSETSNLFLFGLSQKMLLDRQLYIGLIVGGGMGLLASVVGILTESLDDPWELFGGSHLWGAIIWLGLAVLVFLVKWISHVEWEFGFGYGWDISLMAVEAAILTPIGITYWLTLWIKGAKVQIV